MLRFERKPPVTQDVVGIRPHWDQSFVNEDRQMTLLFHDETLLSPFCHQQQPLDYENISGAVRQIKPSIIINNTSRCSNDLTHCYVNYPMSCQGGLSVPRNAVPLRLDLSPMSPRAQPSHTASARSSTVVQLAMSRLQQSGFYYGPITPSNAQELLHTQPPGTFLVRDSSDKRFLFSLTVRIPGMTRHLSCIKYNTNCFKRNY